MNTSQQEQEKRELLRDFDKFVENFGLDVASALYANEAALETIAYKAAATSRPNFSTNLSKSSSSSRFSCSCCLVFMLSMCSSIISFALRTHVV